jgi:thioredoxin-like negative regulator of GroEL
MSATHTRLERDGAAPRQPQRQPTLLFFFSPTSGASRRAEGYLAQVLQRRANHSSFRLVRIDTATQPDLVERLQVTELPTLIVAVDGDVRGRLSKPTGCAEISRLLTPWLK